MFAASIFFRKLIISEWLNISSITFSSALFPRMAKRLKAYASIPYKKYKTGSVCTTHQNCFSCFLRMPYGAKDQREMSRLHVSRHPAKTFLRNKISCLLHSFCLSRHASSILTNLQKYKNIHDSPLSLSWLLHVSRICVLPPSTNFCLFTKYSQIKRRMSSALLTFDFRIYQRNMCIHDY